MLKDLQNLSQTATTVTSEQVVRVVTAVGRKVNEFLNSSLIRVYRKDRTRTGALLEPFATISEGEIHLDKISITDKPQGLVSWCVHNEKPIWLEELQNTDTNVAIRNCAFEDSSIEPEYLELTYHPDSIMVLPITANAELVGVLVIELDHSNKFTIDILREFERLCISLGRLMQKSQQHNSNIDDTTRGIEQFLTSLSDYEFPKTLKTGNVRTGFIARPFGNGLDDVGQKLTDEFKKFKANAIHYQPPTSSGFVISGIIDKIRRAHFYVVDLTSLNRNVLLELGLILAEDKNESKCLLIRDKDDEKDLPFDVAALPVHKYKYTASTSNIDVWTAGSDVSEPLSQVLTRFFEQLEDSDPVFRAANPYEDG